MLGISLERTLADPVGIEVVLSEAVNIDRPEIEGRLALGDPFGERHAGTTSGRDTERVEPGADIYAANLGSLAENEVAIGREAFRAIDELLDARRLHGRNAAYSELKQGLEMLEVVFEKLELEAIGKPIDGPGY